MGNGVQLGGNDGAACDEIGEGFGGKVSIVGDDMTAGGESIPFNGEEKAEALLFENTGVINIFTCAKQITDTSHHALPFSVPEILRY